MLQSAPEGPWVPRPQESREPLGLSRASQGGLLESCGRSRGGGRCRWRAACAEAWRGGCGAGGHRCLCPAGVDCPLPLFALRPLGLPALATPGPLRPLFPFFLVLFWFLSWWLALTPAEGASCPPARRQAAVWLLLLGLRAPWECVHVLTSRLCVRVRVSRVRASVSTLGTQNPQGRDLSSGHLLHCGLGSQHQGEARRP